MKIYDFVINGISPSLNMPTENLRFSWKISADEKNTVQSGYEIIIRKGADEIFTTGTVNSDESCEVKPEGLTLEPETDYTAVVKVKDNYGNEGEACVSFLTELGDGGWDSAQWIKPKKKVSGWAPYLRTKFTVPEDKTVSRAILYCCGLGAGEFYINGSRTDDYSLEPNGTNYEKTILYRGEDVTGLIKNGGNCLAVLLGEGFYSQSRVWGSDGFVYGDECLICRLAIAYTDGSREVLVSNADCWKYKQSPISTNNVYAGEIYDARLETPDFALYEGSEEDWQAVTVDDTPKGRLTPCNMPPVRVVRKIPCRSLKCQSGHNDGAWIFDMGENFAGIYEVRIPANSPKGAVYVFRTAEAINAGGSLDHRSAGAFATQCIQQDIYIAHGGPEAEIYRPRFTYHGFRYVEITGIHDFHLGYGTMPVPEMITGLQTSTDLKRISTFDCSNEYIMRLDRVMHNTFRSNYHGYPEDCPAREKCGWLGDAEIVCNYALMNYDMTAAYEKYLNDIRTTREVYGTWLMIAPGKRGCGEATPLWGCAQIIIPYWMWKYRNDYSAIIDNIDLMREWVEHEINRSEDFIITEGLGDWDPAGGNDSPRRMPVKHSSTLMFYEISSIMAEISDFFGFGDGEKYKKLAEQIKESVIRNFYDKDKHTYGYWGTNGVALTLGIYPDGERKELLASTVELIKADNYAQPTGIYGNKYLIPQLLREGFGDVAMKYMFTTEEPSFATMLDAGATSFWECIDMRFIEDRYDKGVASYNHPMHGGFMYTYMADLAGIQPIEPGFKKFRIRPCRVSEINKLSASYDSPYGIISVRYETKKNGITEYEITVPANTCAVIELEGSDSVCVGSGTYNF